MSEDNIDMLVRRGKGLDGPLPSKDRYFCPVTGAHFEWTDMCKRLVALAKQRIFDPKDISSNGGKRLNKELKDENAIKAVREKQQHEMDEFLNIKLEEVRP